MASGSTGKAIRGRKGSKELEQTEQTDTKEGKPVLAGTSHRSDKVLKSVSDDSMDTTGEGSPLNSPRKSGKVTAKGNRYASRGNSVGIARSEIPAKRSPTAESGPRTQHQREHQQHHHQPTSHQQHFTSRSQMEIAPAMRSQPVHQLSNQTQQQQQQLQMQHQHHQLQQMQQMQILHQSPFTMFHSPMSSLPLTPASYSNGNCAGAIKHLSRKFAQSTPDIFDNCNRQSVNGSLEITQTVGPSVMQLDVNQESDENTSERPDCNLKGDGTLGVNKQDIEQTQTSHTKLHPDGIKQQSVSQLATVNGVTVGGGCSTVMSSIKNNTSMPTITTVTTTTSVTASLLQSTMTQGHSPA